MRCRPKSSSYFGQAFGQFAHYCGCQGRAGAGAGNDENAGVARGAVEPVYSKYKAAAIGEIHVVHAALDTRLGDAERVFAVALPRTRRIDDEGWGKFTDLTERILIPIEMHGHQSGRGLDTGNEGFRTTQRTAGNQDFQSLVMREVFDNTSAERPVSTDNQQLMQDFSHRQRSVWIRL